MSNILVTGGLGFIGSYLADSLADKGHTVVVIDNLCSDSSSRDYIRSDVEYWIDDIRNINHDKYRGRSFDVVYHLAALARIQPSFIDPLSYISTDIMGTAHVLEFARNNGAKLIYAGSSSAYADTMLNPYSFAKYTGEQTCELYSRVYGMSTVIARFFNVYGDRHPHTGAYATVVGVFEQQLLNKKPLTVTGTGEQLRDFTHVSDVVEGLESLAQNEWHGNIFQLGTGENYSINKLAAMFGGNVVYIPARPGEAWETLADYSDIKNATGWSPKVSLKEYVASWKQKNSIE